jgi:two-component system chemotaxis response regulator CheY
MKTLIVEDDFSSRLLLMKLLSPYGEAHPAVNGIEAVEVVRTALEAGEPYNLICLDLMMPEMDGQTALKHIRDIEESKGLNYGAGAKIIMTTAVNDLGSVAGAYKSLCDGYLVKPIIKAKLLQELAKLGLLPAPKTAGTF